MKSSICINLALAVVFFIAIFCSIDDSEALFGKKKKKVSCIWGAWSDKVECSETCGTGTKIFTRKKLVEEENVRCYGDAEWRYGTCNTGVACAGGVDCDWGEWSKEPSACSKTCGDGTRKYTRSKSVKEENGGICSGTSENTEKCNLGECPGEVD